MIFRQFPFFIPAIVFILLSACSSENEADSAENIELPNNKIEIRDAWARPAQKGMTGGAYLTIANGMEQADTLLSVSTNAAAMAEVHESFQQENGLAGMRPAGKLAIEPKSTLQLKPGGYHIMMMQMNRELAVGDTVSASLHFSRHDSLEIQIPVRQNHN